MAAKEKGLEDLFLATLKDVYYAEKQILRALPKMAKAAEDELRRPSRSTAPRPRAMSSASRRCSGVGKKAQGKTCEAIQGIIEEGKEIMEDFAESEALDAGLIAAAQAVEHYEISRYGTLRTWAGALGLTDAAASSKRPWRRRRRPTSCSRSSPRRGSTRRRRDAPAAAPPPGGGVPGFREGCGFSRPAPRFFQV